MQFFYEYKTFEGLKSFDRTISNGRYQFGATHFLEAEAEQQGMSITSHFILSSIFPSERDFLCRVSGLHPLGAAGTWELKFDLARSLRWEILYMVYFQRIQELIQMFLIPQQNC